MGKDASIFRSPEKPARRDKRDSTADFEDVSPCRMFRRQLPASRVGKSLGGNDDKRINHKIVIPRFMRGIHVFPQRGKDVDGPPLSRLRRAGP